MAMNQYQKSKGFTLIELMVTVAIMGIMAAIAFPSMSNFISNTRLTNRSQQVANIFRLRKVNRYVWVCLLSYVVLLFVLMVVMQACVVIMLSIAV